MIDALAGARHVTAADEAPQTGKGREGDPYCDDQHRDLQPDKAADSTQNDLEPVAPGRRYRIADALDGTGSYEAHALSSRAGSRTPPRSAPTR